MSRFEIGLTIKEKTKFMNNINKPTNFKPELLDLVMKDPEYVLYYGDAALKTKGGNDISHMNES